MNTTSRLALVALTAALVATTATAGMNSSSYVRVYTTSAYGPVHDARFNSGNVEYIGCSMDGTTYNYSGRIYCSARDAQHDFLSCYKTNPNVGMRLAVASINEASNIEFRVDSSGQCSNVYVANYSNRL